MSEYSWVPVFKAITNELSKYENNQLQLIQFLKEIGIDNGLTDQNAEGEFPLEEIDPFTFFSMFMKYGLTKRSVLFSEIIKKFELSIEAPSDFSGVPSSQAVKVWLFPYKKERNSDDIPTLWKLFNEAINNNVSPETFAQALQINNVGFAKLTQCLFYCFPDRYFPIDSQTRPFLEKHDIDIPANNWESYLTCLEKIKTEFESPFYELSYVAWDENTQSELSNNSKLVDRNICLLGTWKTASEELDVVEKSIQENGGWASWWSFVIKNEVIAKLKKPFNFYPNVGGGNFPFRLEVDDYVTSKGNEGRKSPWQSMTFPECQNKTSFGTSNSEVFKTWLKVVKVEYLKEPLTLNDFEPASPFSHNRNLLNQNAFGYVYEKTVMNDSGVKEQKVDFLPYSYEDAFHDIFIKDEKIKTILNTFKAKKNIVLQGPPGVGKTFVAKKLAYALIGKQDPELVQMIQFHQTYSYEDFIEGYRPSETGFKLKKGIFYKFCEKAKADPNNKYVFIIDEINRGNLSKIFGELMLLLENDKRGSEWAIPLTYSDEKFHVPENLYFMGLMNTADRSLAVVDYALRRRFSFIDLKPGFDSDKFKQYLLDKNVSEKIAKKVIDRLGELNRKISSDEINLGHGFCVGHSFFCSKSYNNQYDDEWYEQIIKTEIEPLLREYWFDDLGKANSLVADLLS